ncbi:Hypothetical_protein [Hexamita inflata]|uniref:Hypothetical_protein n=1 Tax=Hexamita inflata TaxID=28002 RepID=A0AA86NZZ4_9EUKA|nr:Hypothetical protein HINF_LOCUS16641 [Hexamita inflata]
MHLRSQIPSFSLTMIEIHRYLDEPSISNNQLIKQFLQYVEWQKQQIEIVNMDISKEIEYLENSEAILTKQLANIIFGASNNVKNHYILQKDVKELELQLNQNKVFDNKLFKNMQQHFQEFNVSFDYYSLVLGDYVRCLLLNTQCDCLQQFISTYFSQCNEKQ